jgi:hypothetical protein
MGFGSYDESEQDNQQIDTDDIETAEERTTPTHDGEVRFEYDDASSEDLLETYEEFKSQ